MSHHDTDSSTPKPGRKPSPLTGAKREYDKAKARADRARKAYEKVQHVADDLEAAKREEAAAYQDLQNALADLAPPSA